MNLRTFPMAVILFLALVLALPQGASAEAVGHFTQVHGRVDLLKGGKLPATPVKVGDGVEEGDVLRAKSLSKAQITFVDQSTLTISPETRIAIEKYMFDPAKGKRSALLQLFQGMVLAVVSKIYQTEQPDFVVKTHTAIMGIRGTEVGIRLTPNSSQFLNFQGLTRVCSNFPEIPGCVNLKTMEGTEVLSGKTPMLKYDIFPEDRKLFMMQMNVAVLKPQAQAAVCSAGSPAATACASTAVTSGASAATSAGEGLGSGSSNSAAGSAGSFTGVGGPVIIQPVALVTQAAPTVTTQTFSFTSQLFYTDFTRTGSTYSGALSSLPGTITGASPATFNAITNPTSFNISAQATSGTFSPGGNSGYLTFQTVNANPITLSGPVGGALSGSMPLSAWIVPELGMAATGTANFTLNGTATLQNNTLTYTTAGTFTVPSGTGVITGTTTGTLTQTLTKTK